MERRWEDRWMLGKGYREHLGQRRGEARKMKGSDWAGLTTGRDLKGNVFG